MKTTMKRLITIAGIYTWATFLQRNRIAQRFAMKLMRHSDIKLTA